MQNKVLDTIKPSADEIVLPKTSADVFTSTNLDYLLRCLDIKYVVLAGCVTDQCVESAVRHACDLGYLVTLITDGCATMSEARHDNSLRAIAGSAASAPQPNSWQNSPSCELQF
eukprot:jgi/Botrbrau1/18032/Bobra.0062s0023.2